MLSSFSYYVNHANPVPKLATWRNLTQPPPTLPYTLARKETPKPEKITRENCPVQYCQHCKKPILFRADMSVSQYCARKFCSIKCDRITSRSRITPAQMHRIFRLRAGGFEHADIAKRMKLAKSTVGRVLRGVGLYKQRLQEIGLTPLPSRTRKRTKRDDL